MRRSPTDGEEDGAKEPENPPAPVASEAYSVANTISTYKQNSSTGG
jgi:hypothetical protein